MPVYVVHAVEAAPFFDEVACRFDAFEASDGLWFIDFEGPQSRLYHELKHRLRPHGGFLVATLAGPPKFKNLRRGALSWIRSRRVSPGPQTGVKGA